MRDDHLVNQGTHGERMGQSIARALPPAPGSEFTTKQDISKPGKGGSKNESDLATYAHDAKKTQSDIRPTMSRDIICSDEVSLSKLREAAAHAARAEDWIAAIQAWERLSSLIPHDPESFLGRASAWRYLKDSYKADLALSEFLERNPTAPDIAVSFALNAQVHMNWDEALERSQDARQTFQDVPVIWALEAAMLQILGRLDEAEALTTKALGLFSGSIDLAAQHTNVALARHDWISASRRWHNLERDFPGHGYIQIVGEDIRRIIAAGLSELSRDEIMRGAAEADASQNPTGSVLLWRIIYEQDTSDSVAICGYGQSLSSCLRFNEADRLLEDAIQAYPENAEIQAYHAEIAVARKDWIEATRRWRKLMRKDCGIPAYWVLAALTYIEAGLFTEAEHLLLRALEREPQRPEWRIHHARLAERQDDWATAVVRWDLVLCLMPDDPNIQNSRGDAIWQESAKRIESGDQLTKLRSSNEQVGSTSIASEAAEFKSLALGFEGLGDNCEFGIVQRRLGADPIGLFRFAAISANNLSSLAEESFEQLGNPDYISLSLTNDNEYMVTDTRGLYHMHSFVKKGSVEEPKFLRQQISRLGFLKRKLIEDLGDAGKIFVYKSSLERIENETVLSMHRALSRFGGITLLAIRQEGLGHPPGSVEVLDDRILVGYVRTVYGGESVPIDLESWRHILPQARRHKTAIDRL